MIDFNLHVNLSFVLEMDRVLCKVLALPIFDDEFVKALIDLKLDCVEKFVVLEVSSGEQFLDKILLLDGQAGSTSLEILAERRNACSILIEILNQSKQIFLNAAVSELGFAHSQSVVRGREKSRIVHAVHALAHDSVLGPFGPPVKRPKGSGIEVEKTLKDVEATKNAQWTERLRQIGDRAGKYAKINLDEGEHVQLLTDFEKDAIKKLVLSMGSYRTLQVHVRHWERFEEWAAVEKVNVFPVLLSVMVKYALFLKAKNCGPTVIPSFLTAVNFVGYRLAIEVPDTRDVSLKAIVDNVIQERGKETKEAQPFPIEVIAALEFAVENWIKDYPALALHAWWTLIMIYGSLRFDDACHVDPSTLHMTNEGLFGVVWQTKTERKRKGTKFAVPLVGLTGRPWLEIGWEEFKKIEPAQRDFFIPELYSEVMFTKEPPTYQKSLAWLKYTIVHALRLALDSKRLTQEDMARVVPFFKVVTWHSCRVTLLSLAVLEGEHEQSIGLQANWKNPGPMVMKYARDRKQVALKMLSRLIVKMKDDWTPQVEAEEGVVIDDDEDAQLPEPPEFFVKDSNKAGRTFDLKFHVKALGLGQTKTACKKFLIKSLVSVGSLCPDITQLCQGCAKARQDLID